MCLKWFRTDFESDPSIIKCSPAIQTENPGLTLLITKEGKVGTMTNWSIAKFWNFNLLVLRAPWTDFDDFRCKMTAFGSTFRKTKRKHFFRKSDLSIFENVIFMEELLLRKKNSLNQKWKIYHRKHRDISKLHMRRRLLCLDLVWTKYEVNRTRNKDNGLIKILAQNNLQTDPLTWGKYLQAGGECAYAKSRPRFRSKLVQSQHYTNCWT